MKSFEEGYTTFPASEVYYCPLMYEGYLSIACLQWFDEYDYNESRFFRNEFGDRIYFESEENAVTWMNNNIKEEKIHPEYRRPSWHSFLK